MRNHLEKSNNWFFSRLSKLSAKNRYFILKSLLKAGGKTYYNQAIDTVVPAQELGDVPKKPAPENEHWGYHLIIDMSGCSNTDKHDHVLSFFENLIKKLKMKPLSKPVITSVHGGEQGRGTSCMQLITTSSITYHSDDQKNCIYLDIFTCFSDDTEILTDKGWKLFSKLDKTEKVATLNINNKEIEYQLPTAYQEYDYNGELINLTSVGKSFDLLVTPDHSLWLYYRSKDAPLKKYKVKDLRGRYLIPRTGIWKGQDISFFEIPEYSNNWSSLAGKSHTSLIHRSYFQPAKIVPMEFWLQLLAFYLTEGSIACKDHTVVLTQTKYKTEFIDLLKKLDFPFTETSYQLHITSVQLAQYFKQFGLSHEKYIPDFVKNLSPRLIRIFLDAYLMGDGSLDKHRYYTSSERMADDLQELIFKVGRVANIAVIPLKGTLAVFPNGYTSIRNHDQYCVGERIERNNTIFEVTGKNAYKCIKKVLYTGKVYDVSVPNGTIYVRRNKKPVWSSNCKPFEPKDAFAVIDEYFHPKNIGFKWIFRDCGKWPKHQE